MYACLPDCLALCSSVCMSVSLSACLRQSVLGRYACISVDIGCLSVSTHVRCLGIHVQGYQCVCMCVRVPACVCACVRMHACVRARVWVRVHVGCVWCLKQCVRTYAHACVFVCLCGCVSSPSSPVNLSPKSPNLDKIATETLFVGNDSHTNPEQHIKNIEQSK